MESSPIPTFKVILVGDGGVGKTTLMKRHITGEFTKEYIPTLGVDVRPLTFSTNYGLIKFNIWDVSGTEKHAGLGDGYFCGAQGAILLFDVTSWESYRSIPGWVDSINETLSADLPKVICGNKVDLRKQRKVRVEKITYPRRTGIQYYEISAKGNSNFEKPFLHLAKKLTGHDDLRFVEAPAVHPPTISSAEGPISITGDDFERIGRQIAGKCRTADELIRVFVQAFKAHDQDITHGY